MGKKDDIRKTQRRSGLEAFIHEIEKAARGENDDEGWNVSYGSEKGLDVHLSNDSIKDMFDSVFSEGAWGEKFIKGIIGEQPDMGIPEGPPRKGEERPIEVFRPPHTTAAPEHPLEPTVRHDEDGPIHSIMKEEDRIQYDGEPDITGPMPKMPPGQPIDPKDCNHKEMARIDDVEDMLRMIREQGFRKLADDNAVDFSKGPGVYCKGCLKRLEGS